VPVVTEPEKFRLPVAACTVEADANENKATAINFFKI
jgi:hypothetical protein